LLENELKLTKQRDKDKLLARENDLVKREKDLSIRERLIEEKRIEYSFKQKELNVRIKSQMTWPLNCLENESKLMEKFKDFKLKPDHLKSLDQDSNFSQFLQRDENKELLRKMTGELLPKCEGLLQFEYMLLKERAKTLIVKESYEKEIVSLHSQKEELYKDREKYSQLTENERSIQEQGVKIDEQRNELI
jgi:hypothetical protein